MDETPRKPWNSSTESITITDLILTLFLNQNVNLNFAKLQKKTFHGGSFRIARNIYMFSEKCCKQARSSLPAAKTPAGQLFHVAIVTWYHGHDSEDQFPSWAWSQTVLWTICMTPMVIATTAWRVQVRDIYWHFTSGRPPWPWLPTFPHPAGGSCIVLGTSSTVKIRENFPHSHRNWKTPGFSPEFCICVTTEQF